MQRPLVEAFYVFWLTDNTEWNTLTRNQIDSLGFASFIFSLPREESKGAKTRPLPNVDALQWFFITKKRYDHGLINGSGRQPCPRY